MTYQPIPDTKDEYFKKRLGEKEVMYIGKKIKQEERLKKRIIEDYLKVISVDYMIDIISKSTVDHNNDDDIILKKENVNNKEFDHYSLLKRNDLLYQPLTDFMIDDDILKKYNINDEEKNMSIVNIIKSRLPNNYNVYVQEYKDDFDQHKVKLKILNMEGCCVLF